MDQDQGNTTTTACDHEVDWLVAGAGAAGMTGAVVAHQLGGSVLVVEKEPLYGGTTAKSGGVAWIPGNHRQAEAGVADSVEEGYRYLKGLIGDSVADARVRAYAERAQEMLRFMMDHSHVDFTALPEYMDYYETVPGYKRGGRSMDPGTISLRSLGNEAPHIRIGHYDGLLMPFNVTVQEGRALGEMNLGSYITGLRLLLRYLLDVPARLRKERDNRLTLGTGLVAKLRRSMMDRDIPLWLNAPMKALISQDGRVIGAEVERDGRSVKIRARRGVLLATGGFSQDPALRQEHQPAPTGAAWSASAPGATGDGIHLGRQVHAALDFMGSAWWSPTYTVPDGRVVALISGKSNPGSIMVSTLGRRFANEAQPYEDLVKAQYASHHRGEATIPCYLLFDAVHRARYPIGHIKPGKVAELYRSIWADGGSPLEVGTRAIAEGVERLAAAGDPGRSEAVDRSVGLDVEQVRGVPLDVHPVGVPVGVAGVAGGGGGTPVGVDAQLGVPEPVGAVVLLEGLAGGLEGRLGRRRAGLRRVPDSLLRLVEQRELVQ